MQYYTKDDLIYSDYTWEITPHDSPKLKNMPDRNRFLSSEGNEILYMINSCAGADGLTTNEDFRKIELLLHDQLPIGTMSQLTAWRWLRAQLDK